MNEAQNCIVHYGRLRNITEEYFGDMVREEDMVMKYSLDEKYKPRDLTPAACCGWS